MSLPRGSLALAAACYGAFGVAYLVIPDRLLEWSRLRVTGPLGYVEIGAFYGGLQLGLALFCVLCLKHNRWIRAGLALQWCTFGGAALARLGGLVANRFEPLMTGVFLAEAAMAMLGWIAYRRAGHATESYTRTHLHD